MPVVLDCHWPRNLSKGKVYPFLNRAEKSVFFSVLSLRFGKVNLGIMYDLH
jgi:hypothetical protein